LGYAQATSNQGSITTEVDLTSLSVTVTVGTGRRIRITGVCRAQNDTANSGFALQIQEGVTEFQTDSQRLPAASEPGTFHAVAVITPSAGSHTYKLTGQRQGVGTATTIAAAAAPAFILVEDIGAA